MQAFLKKILLFFLFAGLFYALLLPFWHTLPGRLNQNLNYEPGGYGYMHTRMKDVKQTEDIDVLILGSSHAYRGFDTRIFAQYGMKAFNLGSSAQTPTQTKILLQRYLARLNPKTVIYEVFPATLEPDGVESSLDLITNDRNDVRSLGMGIKLNNIKTWNTLIYGFESDLLGLNDDFEEPMRKTYDEDEYIAGGYVEKNMHHYSPKPYSTNYININAEQLAAFETVVELVKNQGCDLQLVFAPITQVRYGSYSNISYYDSLMTTYGNYSNFNGQIALDDSLHFYDSHHLNQEGVNTFNKILIEKLLHDTHGM